MLEGIILIAEAPASTWISPLIEDMTGVRGSHGTVIQHSCYWCGCHNPNNPFCENVNCPGENPVGGHPFGMMNLEQLFFGEHGYMGRLAEQNRRGNGRAGSGGN